MIIQNHWKKTKLKKQNKETIYEKSIEKDDSSNDEKKLNHISKMAEKREEYEPKIELIKKENSKEKDRMIKLKNDETILNNLTENYNDENISKNNYITQTLNNKKDVKNGNSNLKIERSFSFVNNHNLDNNQNNENINLFTNRKKSINKSNNPVNILNNELNDNKKLENNYLKKKSQSNSKYQKRENKYKEINDKNNQVKNFSQNLNNFKINLETINKDINEEKKIVNKNNNFFNMNYLNYNGQFDNKNNYTKENQKDYNKFNN